MDAARPVTVTCTVCRQTVNGLESPLATAGFYRVADDRWPNGLTLIVCDSCAGVTG